MSTMVEFAEVESWILKMPDSYKDYPFEPGVAVYFMDLKTKSDNGRPERKMFAIIYEKSKPVRLSLKCDPGLAEVLREKYESVLPGYHLNKKHWNTVICSGQLPEDEIKDLIRHSYELVTKA